MWLFVYTVKYLFRDDDETISTPPPRKEHVYTHYTYMHIYNQRGGINCNFLRGGILKKCIANKIYIKKHITHNQPKRITHMPYVVSFDPYIPHSNFKILLV